MKKSLALALALACLCSSGIASSAADKDNNKDQDQSEIIPVASPQTKAALAAIKAAFDAKDYRKATRLLAKQLDEHPDDPATRYYSGLVQKKLGFDMAALEDLDMAARMCPPELIEEMTRVSLQNGDDTLPVFKDVKIKKPPPRDWGKAFGDALANTFNMGTASSTNNTNNASAAPRENLGDFFNDLAREGQGMLKGKAERKPPVARSAANVSANAEIMPMGEMMKLVDTSRSINGAAWASHPEGLAKFQQAPEYSPSWDYWINRFRKAFQYRLLQYLTKEEKGETRGAASGIFSIDNKGNLRGHVYASTGNKLLNDCLVKTMRDLDHSRILAFPADSRVTGFNFRMVWDFGKLLKYVHARKVYAALLKAREAEAARLEAERLEKLAREAKVKAELKAKEEARAKLAKEKALRLAREAAALPIKVEAEVAGRVLEAASPQELKAVALPLTDLRVVPQSEQNKGPARDVFLDIDDRQLMQWPDLGK